ncbi:alpha-galactosidase [Cohnella fermenti]|uniref:Alpha-galactosidase n=1 Tax=Cohnella fermenti TaxID=2565925 RepID=A0A4S4BZL2_9BACL|nr:alpha-galactosidase [Cohnella fermenti]THF80756.1 alpha-galactosidase [Cohnella fermenti]
MLICQTPARDNRLLLQYDESGEESLICSFGFSVKLRGEEEVDESAFAPPVCRLSARTGEGEQWSLEYGNDRLRVEVELRLFCDLPMAEWRLRIGNAGAADIALESVHLARGELRSAGRSRENGWSALNVGLQSTDMHVGVERLQEGRRHYYDSMTVLHAGDGSRNVLLGCVSFGDYFSQVLVRKKEKENENVHEAAGRMGSKAKADDEFEIWIANSMDGLVLQPGASLDTEKAILLVGDGDHDRLLQAYMSRVAGEMKPYSRFDRPATGWLSWYYYYGTVTERDIVENAEAMKELAALRPEYVVIDSGWFLETGFGDWEANSKFGSGMKELADRIRELGFKPGLWLSPLLADAGSLLVRDHPDWLLRKNGVPVAGMNPSGSDVLELHEKNNIKFVLDLTHPQVLAYLGDVVRRVVREWGYRYIKLDFLVRALFTDQGNHSSVDREQVFFPGMTTVQAYRNAMSTIREAAGEDCYILGCAAPLFASLGHLIDANRMTPDITRRNYVQGQERPSAWELVRICAKAMAARYFLNGRGGFNDPDALVVRGHEPEGLSDDYAPTLDEARVWAGVVALSGGLLFCNDRLSTLEAERRPMLSQLFPVGPAAAVPVDFFNEDIPAVWKLPLERDGQRWTVLGIFNWGEKATDISVSVKDIGFAEEQAVHGIDFWSGSYIASGSAGVMKLERLPPRSMRLVSLRARQADRPQLLGTRLHFTQGWAEFASVDWDRRTLTMRWDREYSQRGEVAIWVPDEWRACSVVSNGIPGSPGSPGPYEGNVLRLNRAGDEETLWIRFEE